MTDPARLRRFVRAFTRLVEAHGGDEVRLFADGEPLLRELVAHDDWLPDAFAAPDPQRYRQYLLWCDPLERFSVVSFVWGPGQQTPIHDHGVWGMVGVLRGIESCEEFSREPVTGKLVAGHRHPLPAGAIDRVSPRLGDIHRVSNALPNRTSVSIHVYGANIGAARRYVYDPETGVTRPFVSGYSLPVLPNLWDRSTA